MQLDLDKEELEILTEVVTSYLSDLRYEIADTDSYDYRSQLKARETVLNGILKKLHL